MKEKTLKPILNLLGRGSIIRIALAAALAVGISVGCADVLISVFQDEPAAFSSFWPMLPPLAVTVVVFFLAYCLLCLVLVLPLERLLNLDPIALALALALFALSLFPLITGDRLFRFLFFYSNRSDVERFQAFISVLICLIVSVPAYFVTRAAQTVERYRRIVAGLALALPFGLSETILIVWLWKYLWGTAGELRLLLGSFWLAALITTAWLAYRLASKVRVEAALGALMFAIVLAATLTLIPSDTRNAFPTTQEPAGHRIKQIILIVVDTLRADFVSSYDTRNVATPNMDRLARDGVLFEQAYSEAPWTLPSVSSMMTGLPPTVHLATTPHDRLPSVLPTLAEYLREKGYFTLAIGRNSSLGPQYNLSQGFLQYHIFPSPSIGHSFGAKFLRRVLFPSRFKECLSTDELTTRACQWIEHNSEWPFFLWLHYYDPHQPLEPPWDLIPDEEPPARIGRHFSDFKRIRGGLFVPSAQERQWIKELYRGEVRYVDRAIGRLIKTLEAQGLYDESLIVLTSDHGEEFWEHGGIGHGHTLKNELLRIPLIFKLPEQEFAGTRIEQPISNSAIMPTILDLCGIELEEDIPRPASLALLWKQDASATEHEPIISTGLLYYEDRVSVIHNGLKYVRSRVDGREELYNLKQDPEERASITPSSGDRIQEARDILQSHDQRAEQQRQYFGITGPDSALLDKETQDQLRAIGYIN